MSSTYSFAKELGFEPHYFIPNVLLDVFNSINESAEQRIKFNKQWVSEEKLSSML